MSRSVSLKVLAALALLATLAGCSATWQATVLQPDGSPFPVDRSVLKSLRKATEGGKQQPVPLEQVLYAAGHPVVERLIAIGADGTRHEYNWAAMPPGDQMAPAQTPAEEGGQDRDLYGASATWLDNGRLSIAGEEFPVSRLEVQPPALLGQVQASITDLAPTVAAALGLRPPAQATGRALAAPQSDHVLVVLLDGLGYIRYTEAVQEGLLPNLAGLGTPKIGLTVYPPVTNVATAALLTGAPPEVNGVNRRGVRTTEIETLLDIVAAAGRQTVVVEGESLPFNLPNAEIQLSGDRDGNGSTDDNVLSNAMAVLAGGMPDLLFVHFHGIDDAGHDYGPNAEEEAAQVQAVDAAVGKLIEQVPPGTLVLLLADHGQHVVFEEDREGNHGRLVERDMFIPIWVIVR